MEISPLQYLSFFLDAASRSRVRGNVSHRPEFALARSHERVRGSPLFPRRCTLSARSPEDSEITRGKTRRERANLFLSARARAHFRSCRVRLCVDRARGRNHESSSRERSFLLRFSLLLLSLRPPPPAPPLSSLHRQQYRHRRSSPQTARLSRAIALLKFSRKSDDGSNYGIN